MQLTKQSVLFNKHTMVMFALLTCQFFASQSHAGPITGSDYDRNESMRANAVNTATIEDMRKVVVHQNQGAIGQYGATAVGGLLGGLLGNSVSSGNKRVAATAVLAAVGGAAGYKANQYLSKDDALEIILRMNDGRFIAVTQPIDHESQYLQTGDKVRLIQGANLRVVKINTYQY